MKDIKLHILGLLVLIGYILLIVGAFTPCWIMVKFSWYYGSYSQCGNVSFTSGGSDWVVTASIELWACIILYAVMVFTYSVGTRRVRRIGYFRVYKKWFSLLSLLAALVIFLIVFSVVSTVIAFQNYNVVLGYSAWIAVSSAGVTVVVWLLSTFIVVKECWDDRPPFQNVQVIQQQQPQTVQMVQVHQTTGVPVYSNMAPPMYTPQAASMYQVGPPTQQVQPVYVISQ